MHSTAAPTWIRFLYLSLKILPISTINLDLIFFPPGSSPYFIGFIKSVTQLFDCDPEPECSPNDVHTMQGGGGDGGTPSEASVAKSATDEYIKPRDSYGSNTLADRRSQEAKKGRTVSQAETKALIDSPKTAGKKYIPPRSSY